MFLAALGIGYIATKYFEDDDDDGGCTSKACSGAMEQTTHAYTSNTTNSYQSNIDTSATIDSEQVNSINVTCTHIKGECISEYMSAFCDKEIS